MEINRLCHGFKTFRQYDLKKLLDDLTFGRGEEVVIV